MSSSWTYAALRFPTQAEWLAAAGERPEVADVLEVGVVHAPLPPGAAEDAAPEDLPGWHVAVAVRGALPASWAAARIAPPAGMPMLGRNSVPASLPVRAFIVALRLSGWITPAESLAALKTGDMPPVLLAAVRASLPADAALLAEETWAGMVTVERTDPMFGLLLPLLGRSPAELDEVFRLGAGLA